MASRRDLYNRIKPMLAKAGINYVIRGVWTPGMNPPLSENDAPVCAYWEETPGTIEGSDSYGYRLTGEITLMTWVNQGTLGLTDPTMESVYEAIDDLHDNMIGVFQIGYGTNQTSTDGSFFHAQTMAYKPKSMMPYYYFQDGPWYGFELKLDYAIQVAPSYPQPS